MFTWKRIDDGVLAQEPRHRADSAEELFEQAGFGAVDVDKPLKGWIAVEAEVVDGVVVEVMKHVPSL